MRNRGCILHYRGCIIRNRGCILHPSPQALYSAPQGLYCTFQGLYSSLQGLYSTQQRLCSAPQRLYSTLQGLHSASQRLHPAPQGLQWAALYITKIRAEEEAARKRSDDILVKAHLIIDKADQLNKFQKLIAKAEKTFQFGVNYTSGVVLERNSLLNLAIIEKRHKISKWLIEEKGADIESCDRGSFTPLMNAAWAGDKHMVRYLLAKGCCRVKVGFNHSSKGLAASTFKGLTAEGWAKKRGHDGVAELIRLGL